MSKFMSGTLDGVVALSLWSRRQDFAAVLFCFSTVCCSNNTLRNNDKSEDAFNEHKRLLYLNKHYLPLIQFSEIPHLITSEENDDLN